MLVGENDGEREFESDTKTQRVSRLGDTQRASSSIGLRVYEMGYPHALPNGGGESEAPSGGETPPMAGALPVPRAADDVNINSRLIEQQDYRRLACAGEASILLRRLRVDSKFQTESAIAGSFRRIIPVFQDFGSELSGKKLQRRCVVRERPVRARDGGQARRRRNLPRGISGIHEIEDAGVPDKKTSGV